MIVVYMLYKHVFNKHGEKSNRWSLCLSVSHVYGRPSSRDKHGGPSSILLIPASSVQGEIFSKSTDAQTKLGHVRKTTPLLRVICTSRAYAMMPVSVCLSMTEVHWCIVANLGFKFRSHFTAHCGHHAVGGRRT